MKYQSRYLFMICTVVGLVAIFYVITRNETVNIKTYTDISGPPSIYPDYTDLVIPSNIAPLNFQVQETGEKYFVRIYTSANQDIEIVSTKSQIIIPLKKWRKLLRANQGKALFYDVYVMNANGTWQRYQTISNNISNENEEIDSHVVYRRLKPNYNWYKSVGIYQRNLENFDESVVIHGKSIENGCVNCHTFINNNPKSMLLGFRGHFGNDTILAGGGKAEKVGTTFGHTSWHPSGKVAAFSKYSVHQFFHWAEREEVRDVVELDSCVLYYDFRSKSVKTINALAKKEILETHPSWSPDGRYLYFVSAPVLWEDRHSVPPENFEKVKYSLMRISFYDSLLDTFNTPEFSTGPIEISKRELGRVIRTKSETKLKLPITGATPKAGAGEAWRQ